jgi:hypothetical protein
MSDRERIGQLTRAENEARLLAAQRAAAAAGDPIAIRFEAALARSGHIGPSDIAYAIRHLTPSQLERMTKGILAKAQVLQREQEERDQLLKKRKPGRPATSAEALITEIRNIQASKKCGQAEAFRIYAKNKRIKSDSVKRAYRRAKKTMTKTLTPKLSAEAMMQWAEEIIFP